jgi:hypothetical protein
MEDNMAQYLLSIYQPDGVAPPPEALAPVMHNVQALIDETKKAGAWVFNGGLHPSGSATVVRVKDGDMLRTDGPYAEGKEHIGGFMIVKAPNLDGALEWARKLSRALTLPGQANSLPIEVRAVQEH